MNKKLKGTGYMRHRSNGMWEGQYYYDGKHKSIYGTDYNDVRSRLNKICSEIINKTYVEPSRIALADWLSEWLETYSRPIIRQSTYISYETYIRAHITPKIGNFKLYSLTPKILQRFFNDKARGERMDNKEGGLSPKTLKNMRNMLHLALEQARDNDMIVKNPVRSIKLPKLEPREMRVLSYQEQKMLEEVLLESEEPLAAGILISLYTGIRIGELLGLMWSEVDFIDKSIYIKRSLRRQKKLGDKFEDDYEIIDMGTPDTNKTAIMIGRVKTAKSRRKIYLPDKAVDALKKLKEWQEQFKFPGNESFNEMGFVLCTELGKPIEPRTYEDIFKRHIKKAGLSHTNFHATRHTYATRALERGADLNTVADLLGHAQPSTSLNMYGHSVDDRKRKMVLLFNGI